MSNQPPQDPNQPQDPGGYGTPQPPAPQYGTPQPPAPHYGAAPQYGAAPPPPPGYGQMPGGPYATGGPATQPASIKQAVMLMRVGAGLSLIGLLAALVTVGNLKDQITKQLGAGGTRVDQATIDAAVTVGIAGAIVGGLIGAGLWFWMSVMNGKGKSWARVLSTVFFGVSLLAIIFTLAQGATPALSLVVSLISLVLGAYIIFLLYKKESTAFYHGSAVAGRA